MRKRQQLEAQALTMVAAGDVVVVTKIDDRGHVVARTPLRLEVAAKCSHDPNGGQWVCATHGITFSNQFGKDTHIHAGAHQLAWFCFECNTLQVP